MSSFPSNKTLKLAKSEVNVFYREQSPSPQAPVFLLLHGFPTSSHQFRNLIPILASKYRVIAPDLPGYGFTEVPQGFKYTFENFSYVIEEFLDQLGISKVAVYIFDYGAPTALRIATRRPELFSAIISQNGNAYTEGLGEVWNPLREFWKTGNSKSDKDKVREYLLSFDAIKNVQYLGGVSDPLKIAPESYYLDYALLQRSGNEDTQLDIMYDYQNNLTEYPKFQEYFRKTQIPLFAIWGKNDLFFIPPGAKAFTRDLPKAVVRFLDAGHFAGESETSLIGQEILTFLDKHNL